MTIHARIKAARKAKGMTEQQLADLIGVTRAAVQQWEREEKGTAPKRTIQGKVAQALGISLAELLGTEAPYGEWAVPVARTLPESPALEPGELVVRVPLLSNAASMGTGSDVLHDDILVGQIDLSERWVTQRIKPTSPQALRFIHAYGIQCLPRLKMATSCWLIQVCATPRPSTACTSWQPMTGCTSSVFASVWMGRWRSAATTPTSRPWMYSMAAAPSMYWAAWSGAGTGASCRARQRPAKTARDAVFLRLGQSIFACNAVMQANQLTGAICKQKTHQNRPEPSLEVRPRLQKFDLTDRYRATTTPALGRFFCARRLRVFTYVDRFSFFG